MRSLGRHRAFLSKTSFTSIVMLESRVGNEKMTSKYLAIPSVNIGNVSVPRLIIGHLPFLGESYQGDKRNKEYATKFSHVTNTVNLLIKIVNNYAATVIAVSPVTDNPLSKQLLDALRQVKDRTHIELSLVPCFHIPLTIKGVPINDYRRWVTYFTLENRTVKNDLLSKYVRDPILLCRKDWATKFPMALNQFSPYSPDDVKQLQVNYAPIKKAVSSLHGFRVVLAEAGSESDFLAMIGRLDLLREFTHFLKSEFNCPITLGIHHAGMSIPLLEKTDIEIAGYVTPVNRLGALMLPSKYRALKAIRASKKPIIAIKPLAGGRIGPKQAFNYVFNQIRVDASIIGMASQDEVDEDFQMALNALNKAQARS